ncbi:MAG: ArsR/SmtB family transcription factor [Pyrinomonadaceae bacterium]
MARKGAFELDKFFAALADRTRLRLLNLMRDGEVCVCFFAETLGTNNPKISRHLAYLKRTGLVSARRDGKWMHYSLNPPADERASEILTSLLKGFDNDPEMVEDRAALVNVCCSPNNRLVAIGGRGAVQQK